MSLNVSTTGRGSICIEVLVDSPGENCLSEDVTPEKARALAAALIQLAAVAEGEVKP